MKQFIVLLALSLCINAANAQLFKTTTVNRNINVNFINRDSVNLPLNENFEMIEDECAQIIRYGHLQMQERRFTGKFIDVSKAKPQLILTEGNYTAEGLKDGPFITRFLSGKLQAKGNFKNGAYDGKWEIFYDDDKPRLTFEANGGNIKIIDAWDSKGIKTIDNGTGIYRSEVGTMYWKGKLLNGKPDGTWKAINVDAGLETPLLTETYKNGEFKKGNGLGGSYTDSSRLTLVSSDLLPFTRAEILSISLIACDGKSPFKKVTDARYSTGSNSLTKEINRLTSNSLAQLQARELQTGTLIIDGQIAPTGKVINVSARGQATHFTVGQITNQIRQLSFAEPATIDGKPVTQKFIITFNFYDGMYNYDFKLLPLDAD